MSHVNRSQGFEGLGFDDSLLLPQTALFSKDPQTGYFMICTKSNDADP